MENERQTLKPKHKGSVWDCESSLYDSFELKSFQRQLNATISAGRTMSMPRLSSASLRREPPPLQPSDHNPTFKKHSRLTRSFSRLLRSVFRPLNSRKDEAFYLYDTSGALSTIPEVPEFDLLSPEMKSLVTRTWSHRFMPTSLGISCV